jgi:superfamily II DNA or RNA helicase
MKKQEAAALPTIDLSGLRPDFETRPYQLRIVSRTLQYIDDSLSRILIESPTGSGKSVMGLLLAREFERRGWSIGWAAMRSNLLRQIESENAHWHFNLKEFRTISMFEKKPPKCKVLFVDEAQHDATASMNHIHHHTGAEIVIGLSATPYRPDRVGLCFQKVIRDIGIHQLIREGYLSPYHHYTIPAFNPGTVAETYLREPDRWGKSIVFFHTQSQCDELQALLRRQGVACEIVNGSTDRERQLDDFESGKLRVLINMMILTEGFDCPSIKTAFIRDSSKGPTVQMGGRVFRIDRAIPAKQIVQSKNTKHPFQKTAKPEEQLVWEQTEWRSITSNQKVDQIASRMALVMAQQQAAQGFVDKPLSPRLEAFARRRDRANHNRRERLGR